MNENFNPYLSVDCVVLGFNVDRLMVLLIEKDSNDSEKHYKLPGSLVHYRENLDSAAHRVLMELTGLKNIFLRQFRSFGDPDRISKPIDIEWLKQTYDVEYSRIVSVAYYALINIDDSATDYTHLYEKASWVELSTVTELAFDHKKILETAHETLATHLQTEPIGFELLPEKFTLRQVQNVYEAIFGLTMDNRNFRKKVLKTKYLLPLKEYQKGEAYRPAMLYRFDRKLYEQMKTENYGFNF